MTTCKTGVTHTMGFETVVNDNEANIQKQCDSRNGVRDRGEAIDHDNEANNGRREQPCSVEPKPCEVDAHFLTKVPPECVCVYGWGKGLII